jgi:hypothetical protein
VKGTEVPRETLEVLGRQRRTSLSGNGTSASAEVLQRQQKVLRHQPRYFVAAQRRVARAVIST